VELYCSLLNTEITANILKQSTEICYKCDVPWADFILSTLKRYIRILREPVSIIS